MPKDVVKNLKSSDGFTLVELVVTAVFISITLVAIINIFIFTGKLNKQARNLAVATALAEKKLEIYRDAGFNALPLGTPAETFTASLPASLGSPKSAVANISSPQAGLKQVDVMISYTDDKKTKKVQVSTYMAQRGINR